MALRVHPMFFKEFASKTWTSVSGIVAELVENSFDEDATKVAITLIDDGSILVEDDAGMDEDALEKFLLVGSPHKQEENRSPHFRRLRSGKYGTGRLGFLSAFKRMVVRTRKDAFSLALELDDSLLEKLSLGEANLRPLTEPSLNREGTEIRLLEPKVKFDSARLVRELRKLPCLKQPLFELYVRQASEMTEWSYEGAKRIEAPRVEGLLISISEHGLDGEIIISKRPLPDDECGLTVMVGGHAVAKSRFGISNVSADRITGWVRGEGLTARFADKSALVEDDAYEDFSKRVRAFLKEKVIPAMSGYVEVEITREESQVYRQVDQLLAKAVHHVIESEEEVEDAFDQTEAEKAFVEKAKTSRTPLLTVSDQAVNALQIEKDGDVSKSIQGTLPEITIESNEYRVAKATTSSTPKNIWEKTLSEVQEIPLSQSLSQPELSTILTQGDTRRLRKTFVLRRVGYRVIPYEDEDDEKEAFSEEVVIYVNKAHPAYRAEAQKGGELLLRHVTRLVSKLIALNRHPEGRDALELQNKLIAEAIRLRQQQKKSKTYTTRE